MSGAWETEPSVFVYCLHVDTVTFNWAAGIRRLQIPGPFKEVVGLTGMPYDMGRNTACQRGLELGADYVMSVDSDVIPPPDTIYRLIRHNLPFVSGMYCRRSPPHAVPVMMVNNAWVTNFVPNSLVEVDLVGAGCLLLRRDFLESIPPQRPEQGKHWFDWRVDQKSIPGIKLPPLSEDFTLCVHAKNYGIKTFVDTSIKCLHVGYAEASLGQFLPLGSTPMP